jgi:hypothetical protein
MGGLSFQTILDNYFNEEFDGKTNQLDSLLSNLFDMITNQQQKVELLSFFVSGDSNNISFKTNKSIAQIYDNKFFFGIQSAFYHWFDSYLEADEETKSYLEQIFLKHYNQRNAHVESAWQAMQILFKKGINRERVSDLIRQIPLQEWLDFAKSAPDMRKLSKLGLIRENLGEILKPKKYSSKKSPFAKT